MLLYHFTCREYLGSIVAEGLTRGEVPLSADRVLNAVKLTMDGQPAGNGVFRGGPISPEQRAAEFARTGRLIPEHFRFPDKQAIRITVKMPSSDRNLVRWLPYARRNGDPDWLVALHRGHKPDRWWLYFGAIPPSNLTEVRERDGNDYRLIGR